MIKTRTASSRGIEPYAAFATMPDTAKKPRRPASRRILSLAASLLVGSALLAGCGQGSGSDANAPGGNQTLEGMAECAVEDQGISYPVFLRVTVDEKGAIQSVEDDGTEVPDGQDGPYKSAQALFDTLVGKGADDLSKIDAISGATYSSRAILEAVRQALP